MSRRVLIMGAAGRDFHVFNTCYRERDDTEVAAFTATQIPHIAGRRYPASLAGTRYPDGIAIHPETELESLIGDLRVDEVVFAYSDVSHPYVEERRRLVESQGATFRTFDVDATMLAARRPVIAVCAVRTGCGKSQTSRYLASLLRRRSLRAVAVRHPMPYGDLERQRLQRFATLEDLERQDCTIEEMEEYEPYVTRGVVVYAGVDYGAILAEAEREADVIVWDGGNNDTPFYRPDLWITVADPHRPGDELGYFPGSINFERADLILINKIDSAPAKGVAAVVANAGRVNPDATVARARSVLAVSDPEAIRGRRVLVVEDGPTLTHGGMKYGAGVVAAKRWGAAEIVDPRPWVCGEIAETFTTYPVIGTLLPAMGYGERQIHDLETTINRVDCDLVLVATPVDLERILNIERPSLRVTYELDPEGDELEQAVERILG